MIFIKSVWDILTLVFGVLFLTATGGLVNDEQESEEHHAGDYL